MQSIFWYVAFKRVTTVTPWSNMFREWIYIVYSEKNNWRVLIFSSIAYIQNNKPKLFMNAFNSPRYLQSNLMLDFSHASMI